MRELLGDSEYGMIIENSEEELYKAIKKILLDKNLYNYYKEKILLRSRKFNSDKRKAEIEQLFDF